MGKPTFNSLNTVKVFNNTDLNLIQITEDKLKVIFGDYTANLKKKGSWTTPLGLIIAIVLTLITSQFQDALFIKAAVWEAIFYVVLTVTVIWFVRSVYYCKKMDTSLETLMKEIKNEK